MLVISRWPRLNSLEEQDLPITDFMLLVRKRLETAAKVQQGLREISAGCFPHGEPSIAQIEALIAGNEPYGFVEDELFGIIFNKNQYDFETNECIAH